jgi:hypothetical protein
MGGEVLQTRAGLDAALQGRHLVDEQTQRPALTVGGQQVVDGILDDDHSAERARRISDGDDEAAVTPRCGATAVSPRALSAAGNRGKQLLSIEQPAAAVLAGAGQERIDVGDRQRGQQQLA